MEEEQELDTYALIDAGKKAFEDPNLKLAARGEYEVQEFKVGPDTYVLKVVAELKEKEV